MDSVRCRLLHLHLHRLGLLESRQFSAAEGLQAEAREAGDQTVGITQNGWQDGEVGQGSDARFF